MSVNFEIFFFLLCVNERVFLCVLFRLTDKNYTTSVPRFALFFSLIFIWCSICSSILASILIHTFVSGLSTVCRYIRLMIHDRR